MISSQQLRKLFLQYFEKNNHIRFKSSSLVPQHDNSLLFTNAGMVRFKPIFLGQEEPSNTRIVSIQRCLRAGGKHNDLDNVGYTARHHTFFEMLGNFSFGDYFKREAIQLAWHFLTDTLKIPPERLWITVFKDDRETENIWLEEIKIDPTRFSRCDEKDNFWAMGDTGPCGPCTEIFYDHGPTLAGGPPGSSTQDGDRYVEIWNLVFMQYERMSDGQLMPLPKPCIDTGMGFERLVAVMQNVTNNYDTDLFQPLIKAVKQLIITAPDHTLKVIADHIRAISFLITDGITPGNEGRNYILRRIIRRALRHGYQAGLKEPFLYKLVPTLIEQMQDAYPELLQAKTQIIQTLQLEEEQFLRTLHHGIQYFEQALSHLKTNIIPGSLVFKLYDTYGFPADLTADIARERNLDWDKAEFEKEMIRQQQRSQAASVFSNTIPTGNLHTEFSGYDHLTDLSQIIGLFNQSYQPVEQLQIGEKGYVVLSSTPFYAEAGGQVGDQGELTDSENNIFIVEDTQQQNTLHLHSGYVKQGLLKLNVSIHANVNAYRRQMIAQHHTATHLLHAALRKQLGSQVFQKGSLVAPNYLRFDFSYTNKISDEVINEIEHQINTIIWKNLPVIIENMSLEAAQKIGAMALFNEKYQEKVRVLKIKDFSVELCGGTHVKRTGDIGLFKIISLTTIASGIKRIEAVAGQASFDWVKKLENQQIEITDLLKINQDQLIPRLKKQITTIKQQANEITQLKQYLCHRFSQILLKKAIHLQAVTLIIAKIPPLIADQARVLIDQLKSSLSTPSVIALGCITSDKTQISIGISKQYTHHINANTLASKLAKLIDGKGGGRADFAHIQSANHDDKKLEVALKSVKELLVNIQNANEDKNQ